MSDAHRAQTPSNVRSRGEDPPPDDDNSKTGGYPVISVDGPGQFEDPPPDDDNSKTGGYPVISD